MRRRLTALLAGLLAVALLSGGFYRCEESDTHPSAPRVPQQPAPHPPAPVTGRATVPQQPDPHAGDPKPHDYRTITIQVGKVEKAYLPARVQMNASGTSPSDLVDVITTSDVLTWTLTYDADDKGDIHVYVLLQPAGGGSRNGFCWIQAGAAGHDGPKYVAGTTRVQCYLTIKRG